MGLMMSEHKAELSSRDDQADAPASPDVAMMPCEINKAHFLGKEFVFRRGGGEVLAKRIALLRDGSIEGYSHPNEAAWGFDERGLLFLNREGEPTTIFSKLELKDGLTIIHGRFLEHADPEFYGHVLAEIEQAFVPPAPVAIENRTLKGGSADVAVLVRTHRVDEKLYDLLEKLNRGRTSFDVYPIIDETNGRPEINADNVIWHSAAACHALGLTQPHQALLWFCGDFPFYFALREIPHYKHYIMVEYDIDMVRSDASFMNRLADALRTPEFETVDFAAMQFAKVGPVSGWYEACHKVYPHEYCYGVYFPFIIMSKRAAAYLFSQRQLEAARKTPRADIIHCESFAASAAMAGGFRCVDVREIMPGCYDFGLMAMQMGQYGGLGKPLGAKLDIPDGVEMVHPIYGYEEFLERIWRKYVISETNNWDGLLQVLDGPEGALVPEELRSKFRAKIPERTSVGAM